MSNSRRTGAGTGMAVAGLVCGIVGVLPGLLILIGLASGGY
jgi:hypothetical protein